MSDQYRVDYTNQVDAEIGKLKYAKRKLLLHWIDKNLHGCSNPEQYGYTLTNLKSYSYLIGQNILRKNSEAWCYRIDEYHVIAEIRHDLRQILILALRSDNARSN